MTEAGSSEKTVWQQRWEALEGVLLSMETWGVPGIPSFSTLVKCLHGFGKGQFEYFHSGLTESASYGFQPSAEYPPDYVRTVILDQVEYDLAVLRRVAEQRRQGTAEMVDTLERADEMVWRALLPVADAEGKIGGEKTTVITYFHKSPDIRVIPYASVALIGVPYTCVGQPLDFLAIPHEVGHFVFWRGTTNAEQGGELFRKLLPSTDRPVRVPYWFHWVEELFADVYGCLVAGPVKALDFQNLQLGLSWSKFVEDDGEHPVPLLRPAIYPKVLEAMRGSAGIAESLIGELGSRWNDASRARLRAIVSDAEPATYPLEGTDGELFAMSDAISSGLDLGSEPIDAVVGEMLRAPLNLVSLERGWWFEYYQAEATADDLYAAFCVHANALTAQDKTVHTLEVQDPLAVWSSWLASRPYDVPTSGEVPADTWRQLLRADGWVTKGPNTVWR